MQYVVCWMAESYEFDWLVFCHNLNL